MLKRSMCRAVCATALSFSTTAAANDDQALVARLDTEYQAAVKANDAATMDPLLADDFILVLGEGTVYNKADLLKDARNKAIIYEHQEDTRQTVRVWGDTGALTVLLRLKAKKRERANRTMPNSGSLMVTCEHRPVGAIHLARLRCPCRTDIERSGDSDSA